VGSDRRCDSTLRNRAGEQKSPLLYVLMTTDRTGPLCGVEVGDVFGRHASVTRSRGELAASGAQQQQ
jgi:hypothetical protein